MSWDAYRDSLIANNILKFAAVVGHDGGTWTTSAGFNVTPDEVKALLGGLNNSELLQASGVHINGVKYMYIQSDATQIQGKKGATGVSVAKAGKCLVIGAYTDGMQPGAARTRVETIRDHLVNSGY